MHNITKLLPLTLLSLLYLVISATYMINTLIYYIITSNFTYDLEYIHVLANLFIKTRT